MTIRWTKKVAEGLSHITCLAEAELQAHELSEMECRCDACTGKVPDEDNEGAFDAYAPCRCDGKAYPALCGGCRTTEEWGTALAWLNQTIHRHRRPRPAGVPGVRRPRPSATPAGWERVTSASYRRTLHGVSLTAYRVRGGWRWRAFDRAFVYAAGCSSDTDHDGRMPALSAAAAAAERAIPSSARPLTPDPGGA